MMHTKALALGLALACVGCEPGPTRIIAVLRTDLAPGYDFVAIELSVTGATLMDDPRFIAVDERGFRRTFSASDSTSEGRLPFSVVLVPDGAPSATVRVRALDEDGALVVEQIQRATFRDGATTRLDLALDLDCVGIGIACDDHVERTCVAGRCEAIDTARLVEIVPGTELDTLSPPPTLATRRVQQSVASSALAIDVGEARGGTFALGADDLPAASPINTRITVSSFRIDAKEATIARFRTFLGTLDRAMRGRVRYPDGTERSFSAPLRPTGEIAGCSRIVDALEAEQSSLDARPIACIDWHTALAFCVFEGGRLPTSAEWEYVAHGRGGATIGARYPWGDREPAVNGIDDCLDAWFYGCDASDLWPQDVGRLSSGAQDDVPGPRVYDLAGNVAEWTADRYEPYADRNCFPQAPRLDPSCPLDDVQSDVRADAYVIIRGGAIAPIDSADDGVTGLRAAAIMPRRTVVPSPYVGVRCVYDHVP